MNQLSKGKQREAQQEQGRKCSNQEKVLVMPGKAYSCPLGENSKPISIDNTNMLRKDDNGTSLVAIAKHPTTHWLQLQNIPLLILRLCLSMLRLT